ncbi:hypothetical protein ACLOJK_012108 [Asimina triloba]
MQKRAFGQGQSISAEKEWKGTQGASVGRSWPFHPFISFYSTINNRKVVNAAPFSLFLEEMEFDFIIKVKHRETLRRFNAYGTGNILHLNMDELRAKIIDLFNFKPEAHFDLTYIDDDGDTVMLVDDADLWDASISQHLNPLRITVQFAANGCGKPRKSSLGDSLATTRSSHLRTQLPSSYTDYVKEVMGTGQHPFHDALLKLSGASVGPLTEFVESLSKLGLSYLCLLSQCQDGVKLPMPCIGIASNCMDLNTTIRSGVSSDSIAITKRQATTHFVDQPLSVKLKDLNNGNSNVWWLKISKFLIMEIILSRLLSGLLVRNDSVPLVSISNNASRFCEDNGIPSDRNAKNVASSAPLVDHLMDCNQHPLSESTKSSHHVIQSKDASDAAGNNELANGGFFVASALVSNDNKSPMDTQLEAAASTPMGLGWLHKPLLLKYGGCVIAVLWSGLLTQLGWIGGDQFGDQSSIESVIPKNGYPVGEELDIAVHCTAPSSPGNGKKGKGINIMDDHEWKEPIIGANIESSESAYQETKPRFDESPIIKKQLNLEADFGGLIASNGAVQPLIAASASTVQVAEPPSMTNESVMRTLPCKPEGNPVEQALLRELEEMGFQQTYLNKEVLRLNNYNLEQSVEDLCKFNN